MKAFTENNSLEITLSSDSTDKFNPFGKPFKPYLQSHRKKISKLCQIENSPFVPARNDLTENNQNAYRREKSSPKATTKVWWMEKFSAM